MYTPEYFREFPIQKEAIERIPLSKTAEMKEESISCKKTGRGMVVTLPIKPDEDIYGFGLQLRSFNQAGKRRYIKVNSDV